MEFVGMGDESVILVVNQGIPKDLTANPRAGCRNFFLAKIPIIR